MKVVINRCWGGFGLSEEAQNECKRLGYVSIYYGHDTDRTNPILVQVVESLGEKANGRFADLKIVEIPDDTQFTIDDYDGMESIHEVHRSWP